MATRHTRFDLGAILFGSILEKGFIRLLSQSMNWKRGLVDNNAVGFLPLVL
jgi:hypothetical protein